MADLPLDHVAIVSRNMKEDVEFYTGLGFKVETQYDDWAMLRDKEGRGLALLSPAGNHPPHFALRARSRDAVEEIARARNGRIAEHRDRTVSVYLKDPSGNAFEVIFYPPEEK